MFQTSYLISHRLASTFLYYLIFVTVLVLRISCLTGSSVNDIHEKMMLDSHIINTDYFLKQLIDGYGRNSTISIQNVQQLISNIKKNQSHHENYLNSSDAEISKVRRITIFST